MAPHRLLRGDRMRSWPEQLGYVLLTLIVLSVVWLHEGAAPIASRALAVALGHSVVLLLCVVIMGITAQQLRGMRRAAWIVMAVAVALQGIAQLLHVWDQSRARLPAPWSVDLVVVCAHGLLLLGLTVYLPKSSGWPGTGHRMVLDSIVISVAVLLGMVVVANRALVDSGMLWHAMVALAADMGLVFSVSILCLRYGGNSGPLGVLIVLSVVCMVLSNVLLILVARANPALVILLTPCVSLSSVILALGGYASLAVPPRAPEHTTPPLHRTEWYLWSLAPPSMGLLALGMAWSSPAIPPGLVYGMIGLILMQLVFCVHDLWHVLSAMSRARAALGVTNSRLAESETLRVQEVADLCHDARALIYTIRTTVDQLVREARGSAVAATRIDDLGRQVRRACDAQHEMISGLLDATLLEQNTLIPQVECLDLRELLDPLVSEFHERIAIRQASLVIDAPAATWGIIGDAARISRTLRNILDNALRFLPAVDGVIRVTLHRDDSIISCTISDNGAGIDAAQLAILRERFARVAAGELPHGVESRRSTGLGLVLVARLMYLMGGTITVTVRTTGVNGTNVCLGFPAAPELPGVPSAGLRRAPLSGATVLIVDTDAPFINQVTMIVTALGAATTVVCASGEDARARLACGESVHVAIIDEYLAGTMRGSALAAWMHASAEHTHIVRLGCSTADPAMIQAAHGGDPFHAYLSKPIDPGILIITITRSVAAAAVPVAPLA